MFLTKTTSRFVDALLTLAYPQACTLCGLSVEFRKFGFACAPCWSAARIFNASEGSCPKCGIIVSRSVNDARLCGRCESLSFTAARSTGLYEGTLREAVLQLKRKPFIPRHLSELAFATALQSPLDLATRIVPVPLHADRLRSRGFNQALIIAQSLARSLKLPLDHSSLCRVGVSEKYRAGLDPQGRQQTVAGAFKVSHPRAIEGENILLVDDVFTTGATVDSCSLALLGAGARQVFVYTVARTQR